MAKEKCTYHYVSSVFLSQDVRAMLAELDRLWPEILRECPSYEHEIITHARDKIRAAVPEEDHLVVRWETHECGDYTVLLDAADTGGLFGNALSVLGDCIEAMACGYWNGAAACEECGSR